MKLKEKIEKLKEKWFWFTHPNLNYQIEAEEEKENNIRFLQSKESDKYFSEEEKKEWLEKWKE